MSFLSARRPPGEDVAALARQARAWDHPAATPPVRRFSPPPPPATRAGSGVPGGLARAVPWRIARPWRLRPA
ncbi:hypothetical protein LO772_05115 [Yinghuangia sp. ASG 101]|uniref:hypothetical protein n=1 Tax=Yinghuangia sp. ASG 101 TaxID=2896848 RepID=UPI001E29AD4C|nr:hypothetical protein [Yinghuangia sp. ASG 101]UGQ13005.1 hypothetical protein LO772_05115 [Yinghuangia sp. ASG 101]